MEEKIEEKIEERLKKEGKQKWKEKVERNLEIKMHQCRDCRATFIKILICLHFTW